MEVNKMFYVEVEKNVKILVQDLNSAGEKAVFFIHQLAGKP